MWMMRSDCGSSRRQYLLVSTEPSLHPNLLLVLKCMSERVLGYSKHVNIYAGQTQSPWARAISRDRTILIRHYWSAWEGGAVSPLWHTEGAACWVKIYLRAREMAQCQSVHCFCREPGFSSHPPHGGSHLCLVPGLGTPTPSSGHCGILHIRGTHKLMQAPTYTLRIKINLWERNLAEKPIWILIYSKTCCCFHIQFFLIIFFRLCILIWSLFLF